MNTFFFDDVQYPEGLFGGKDFFNPIIYSTEEREVGVGENNKPLYQKTIKSELISADSTTSDILTNIDECHVVDIKIYNSDNTIAFIPQSISMYDYQGAGTNYGYVYFNVTNHSVMFVNQSRRNSVYIKATIQYTKTTDVAGSGEYNTLGIPNVHYDGNEKVIGTWFGETLYEKIINFDYNNIQSRTSSGCEIYINVPNIKDTKDSVILLEGGTIQFPYFVSTSIFIGGFTQTETDTLHISLKYSSSVYNELNAYLTDCRVKLQYTKTS